MRHNTGNTVKAFTSDGGFDFLMQSYQYDPTRYLNIYIVPAIYDNASTESTVKGVGLPRSYLPDNPGLIMRFDYFGSFYGCTADTCNLDSNSGGYVAVHEIGHYLGLLHTFQGGCKGGHGDSCKYTGDLCCDTHTEIGAHYDCLTNLNTCTDEDNDQNDPLHNYMSYRQPCWTEFTPDQKALMHSTLEGTYPGVIEGSNVIACGAIQCGYHTALFSVNLNTACDTGTFVFKALDQNRSGYNWKIINQLGNTVYNASGTSVLSWFSKDIGIYTVILTTTENNEQISYTRTALVKVVNCKDRIKSTNGNWYFGKFAGINFSKSSPLIDAIPAKGNIDGPTINTSCFTACQSTPEGRLLFYAGGQLNSRMKMFNKFHNKLKYGDSVFFNYASSAGILSIPKPHSGGSKFYIITSCSYMDRTFPRDTTMGLYYSILDTALQSGDGAIDVSNRNKRVSPPPGFTTTYVYTPASGPANTALFSTESLIAIPQCNNEDYWLITGAIDNTGNGIADKHLVYRVESGGIFYDHTDNFSTSTGPTTYSVASPDGRWLMSAGNLFSFDRYSGTITYIRTLALGSNGCYAVFSPDSKVLYFYDEHSSDKIYQVDLLNPLRGVNTIRIPYNPTSPIQLGPDGKIYIGCKGRDYMSVIHNPNNVNSASQPNACGYDYKGFFTKQGNKGGVFTGGLPNIIHAKPEDSMGIEILVIRESCMKVKLTANKCCLGGYSWDFGDGHTASGLEAERTYTDKGKYTVSLYINSSLTATKEIRIGVDTTKTLISGTHNMCDLSEQTSYAAVNYDADLDYHWSIVNGTLLSSDGLQNMDAKWTTTTPRYIRLTVSNWEGCTLTNEDTVTANTQVTNNIINMKNKYCGNDTIFGATASGGDGAFKYSWYKRLLGEPNWIDMGIKTEDLTPSQVENKAYEYERKIYSNESTGHGCYYTSNIIKITPFSALNQISTNASTCGVVSTGTDLDTIAGIHYQWQRSTDSITWADVTGKTSKSINDTSHLSSFYFYRRKAYTGSCINYSNAVFAGGNKVIRGPKDITICYNKLSEVNFDFILENEQDTNYNFYWEHSTDGTGVGTGVWIGFSQTDRILNGGDAYYGLNSSYFRCLVTNNCNIITTSPAQLLIVDPLDTILTQPSHIYHVNREANLTIKCKTTRPDSKLYQWQASADHGHTWYDMEGETKDSLVLVGVDVCQHDKTYHLRIINSCGLTFFSDTAHVHIDNMTSNSWDPWIRDQWFDNGNEPNSISPLLTLSPDIFFQSKAYSYRPRKYWNYEPYFKGSDNYVHALIHNRGLDTVKASRLYLYWTIDASGELWPRNWTSNFDNEYLNLDSLKRYPMGGQINTTPISIPDLLPGDSVLLNYKWDNVPNPNWYYPWFGDTKINVCVLARIRQCVEPYFGMTYPEIDYTKVNAEYNNNIAMRNFWVRYLFPTADGADTLNGGKGTTSGGRTEVRVYTHTVPLIDGGVTLFRNMNRGLNYQKLKIATSSSTLFSKANIFISFNDKLLNAWKAGGSVSSNIEPIGESSFRVLSANAYFGNIVTDSGFMDGFAVYFAYKDIDKRFDNDQSFEVDITQHDSDDVLEGSIGYQLMDNQMQPVIAYNDSIINICDWSLFDVETATYTVPNPSLPYKIYQQGTSSYLDINESGTYNLLPDQYLVTTTDWDNDIETRTTLTITSTSATDIESHDTVYYDCESPDEVEYTTECPDGVMYDVLGSIVTPDYPGHYTLDPQEPSYTFVCPDSPNCTRYVTLLTFRDRVTVPSTNYNYFHGSYDRTQNACCFIILDEAVCGGGASQLTFGQELEIYDMTPTFLYSTSVEMIGTSIGFRFCPPQWNTDVSAINNSYSIVFRNDPCSFCRADFQCDSVGDHEEFVILSGRDKLNGFSTDKSGSDSIRKIIAKKPVIGGGQTSLSIRPNPATTEVNITVFNAYHSFLTVIIYDAAGKPVYSEKFNTTNNGLLTKINLVDFESGVYSVYIPELNYYYKLIVIK